MSRATSAFVPSGEDTTTGWGYSAFLPVASLWECLLDLDTTNFVISPVNGSGSNLILTHAGTPPDFGSMWNLTPSTLLAGGSTANPVSMRARRIAWVDDVSQISWGLDFGGALLFQKQIGNHFTSSSFTDANLFGSTEHATFPSASKANWDAAKIFVDIATTTTMSFDNWNYDITYLSMGYEYIKSTSLAPIVMAPGVFNAVTTGTCTVTLPSHQIDDILILCASFWGPNTATSITSPTPPAGWNVVSQVVTSDGDGWHGIYWKRATSGAETNPVLARGTSPTWDTGTDTAYGGVAFVVRGCTTTGNPWDDVNVETPRQVGNFGFIGAAVSGSERTLALITQYHDGSGSAGNDDPSNKYRDLGSPANTTGTDLHINLKWLRDEDSTVGTLTTAGGGSSSGPFAGWARMVNISFKPPTIEPTFKKLIFPSNQAVRRAANW